MQPQYITLSKNAIDLSGKRFGRLIVLGPTRRTLNKRIVWLCQCDCGNTREVVGDQLRVGDTSSCGCLRSETTTRRLETHKSSKHSLYKIWSGMIQRCTNQNNPAFANYGGRGVAVYDEWRYDFVAFQHYATSLSNCGEEGYSLDRIDNSLGYTPGNIKWSTPSEQARNRRNNHLLTYNGKTQPVAAWAKEYGINYGTLWSRLRLGWSIERSLNNPRYLR